MRKDTRIHNIDLITKNFGYRQHKNTTIFKKDKNYMLSPAVSCGLQWDYWFDIRNANLKIIPDHDECILLIRIVPDMFCCCRLTEIHDLLTPQLMENRKNSGDVWGIKFYISDSNENIITLKSKQRPFVRVKLPLLDKKGVLKHFKKKCNL
jgi:hypothetical protein